MSDYMGEAALRLKEIRLLGWTIEAHSFNLTETATLEIWYAEGSEEGKHEIAVWAVREEDQCSSSKASPQEAIAEWLKQVDDLSR